MSATFTAALISSVGTAIFLFAHYAHGAAPAVSGKLPAIVSLTINENAAVSPAAQSSDEACDQFTLTKRDALNFLRQAQKISEHDYLHMLDWSPCYASGYVTFKDGTKGVWGVNRNRGASIRLTDGSTIHLYCPSCHAKAFTSRR